MPNVLVVDDDPAIRVLLKAILEREGFAVVEAGDGVQALACIEQGRFDVIIMDVMMPKLGGLEVLERLAQRAPAHRNVIVLTAAHPRQLEAMKRDCVHSVIRKPFDLEDLIGRIRAACRREILVVEDDPADSYRVERQLTGEGYEVTIAPDGLEALQMLRDREFHALVVDLKLPLISGYDVIEAANSAASSPRTVVLTGVEELPRPVLADAVLHKPAGFDELVPVLRTLV